MREGLEQIEEGKLQEKKMEAKRNKNIIRKERMV
jgi:hypothetical protein